MTEQSYSNEAGSMMRIVIFLRKDRQVSTRAAQFRMMRLISIRDISIKACAPVRRLIEYKKLIKIKNELIF